MSGIWLSIRLMLELFRRTYLHSMSSQLNSIPSAITKLMYTIDPLKTIALYTFLKVEKSYLNQVAFAHSWTTRRHHKFSQLLVMFILLCLCFYAMNLLFVFVLSTVSVFFFGYWVWILLLGIISLFFLLLKKIQK